MSLAFRTKTLFVFMLHVVIKPESRNEDIVTDRQAAAAAKTTDYSVPAAAAAAVDCGVK